MTKAKDAVNAELAAAFEVLRTKLQHVLDRSIAKDVEIKHLKLELKIAHEDIDSTVVIIDRDLIIDRDQTLKGTTMPKTPPQSAQNSPDGTIPPATSIRVLGSGLFTLSGGVVLLNGSAEAAANQAAVELSWKGGQLKAQNDGNWSLWTADVKPEGPQGSWSATTAP